MRLSPIWMTLIIALAGPAFGEAPSTQPALYNGIVLPTPWPPPVTALTYEPMDVPYLKAPPAVIPIDLGRQLFVDDFLIEKTNLHRTFYSARYIEGNPVLKPDKPWEQVGLNPTAMVFSDGVWFDPKDKLFKMWYMGGEFKSTCYATSADGIHWDKPSLDAVTPGTNIVHQGQRDSSTVWLDQTEKDPARRFKMMCVGKKWAHEIFFSADGIHWGEPVGSALPFGDRSTMFYNPFRGVWVFGLRATSKFGRARRYWESADILQGAKYEKAQVPFWVGADRLDAIRSDLKIKAQLYNLDATAYESVMLGFFTIWRGQPKDRAKPNEVLIGWSRDGYHWDRTNRTAFLPVSEHYGDWNWCNVQSAGGGCLVVGDKLYIYCSGRAGIPGSANSGISATGLATLRRDGFASMDSPKADSGAPMEGDLITRPVRFSGKYLFVNLNVPDGAFTAEVLDEAGKVIAPFSADHCVPVRGDSTCLAIEWAGHEDLSQLAGKTIRFHFHMNAMKAGGQFYSFWVSPDKSGASHGFVGAGGPGFDGPTDTVGRNISP